METKPFHFTKLKKYSRKELEITRALIEFLPKTKVREQFHVAIRKMLIKHMGQDVSYFVDAVDMMKFDEFSRALPEVPILVVIGVPPLKEKIIIQIR